MPRKKKEDTEEKSKPTGKSVKSVQPEVNIGLIGHVDHGKTTLTERFSGKWTDTHSEEIKRGITIRLGYANCSFYKCPKCKGGLAYSTSETCPTCGAKAEFLRKISLVDAPGHESLMATMLSGATIMDGALLLVAANEECPQPQTREHLTALQIIGVKNVVILQNKIDLVDKDKAKENYDQIKAFLKGTAYETAPIIPISAQHNVNIGFAIQAIEENIPTPKRDENKDPVMFIARSFDVNKPGSKVDGLIGGVLGGSIKQGKLKVGQDIEIKPGHEVEQKNQKVYLPLKTKIVKMMTGNEEIKEAGPGGSVALLTYLDPSVVKSDKLTGNLVGLPDKLPGVMESFTLETQLLQRVVGTKEELDVEPIKMGEPLMLNVNAAATVGVVTDLGKNQFTCKLKLSVCAEKGERVTISRRVGTRFRLIGFGIIK